MSAATKGTAFHGEGLTATPFVDTAIGEYLRERLMPVEGVIPHLDGIDMYGNCVPAGLAGGDLFEYINFQQRYDLDARIRRAVQLSKEYLQAHGLGGPDNTCVDDQVEWLKARPDFRREMETAYRQAAAWSRYMFRKACTISRARPESCWWTRRDMA